MNNSIVPSDGGFLANVRQIPTPAELEAWVRDTVMKLCLANAEFTAYSVTLRLRDAQLSPVSAGHEIAHPDVQNLVHDVVMPEVCQNLDYAFEQRDWFNARKGVTETATTYLPAKFLQQKLQAQVNVVPVTPATLPATIVMPPATPASTQTPVQTPAPASKPQTFGFVIDDEE